MSVTLTVTVFAAVVTAVARPTPTPGVSNALTAKSASVTGGPCDWISGRSRSW
jgi:hypothetical protein